MTLGFKLMAVMMAAASTIAPAAAPQGHSRCQVVGADKLPAASGGAKALCAALAREIGRQASGADYHATVTVVSKARLKAIVHLNGRALPEQGFSSMDRPLAKSSFDRFAKAIASQVGVSARR